MPQYIYKNDEKKLEFNQAQTTAEGRNVSNPHLLSMCQAITILCPSGTAGTSLWANNSKEYNYFNQHNFNVHGTPGTNPLYGNQGSFDSLQSGNQINPSFTSNWINVTNDPAVKAGASAYYVQDATYRYVRLGYSSSSTTGAVGYVWTTDMLTQ
jgi:hypothetical protein